MKKKLGGFSILALAVVVCAPLVWGGADAGEQERPPSVLVLLGEWFGDAYFPLEKEIAARGWTMKRVGVDVEYRGCYNKKRDIVLRSDILIPELKDFAAYDCLIIPSGPQWRKFNENPVVLRFVREAHAAGLLVASFCVGNFTVKAAGLIDLPQGPALFPEQVTMVKERVLLGPRGGGPPPGDGFESAPIKEVCDAIERELAREKGPAAPAPGKIHEAVRKGDLAEVQALVAGTPAAVNEKDARGRTPLHFAGYIGNMEIVAFLISRGADVKAADPGGFTPLHWASSAGKADAARALIAAGADPNGRSVQGVTPLESALYGRKPEAVAALIEGGLRIEAGGEEGRALLHRAASAGFGSLVDYLLSQGADSASRSDAGGTLLHSAAAGGLATLVGTLIDGGADANAPDDLGRTPLHHAAASGRSGMVDLLLGRGADMKAACRKGRTLVHYAASGGLVELLEKLDKQGFPLDRPDRYGRTPLLCAAEAGGDAAAEFLISRGANVMSRDFFDQTPLHEAAFSGNLKLLELLVKHGAELEAVNQEGSTPFLFLSQAGREESMNWLLEHGAKLDVRNSINETPLSWPLVNGFQGLVEKLWPRAEALKNRDLLEKYPLHRVAYHGNAAATAFLLGKNLPLEARDESGRTPFQRAAQGGNAEAARMLLDRGAKLDAPDPEGSTPLHLAVKKGRAEMARFLVRNGAGLEIKDGKNRTALDLAKEYAYPEITAVLQEAGAKAEPPSVRAADVSSFLAMPLRPGEAIVWSLGHCGFAVKTRSRLLIFDYFGGREPRPDLPSLANGFVNPDEIKDQNVVVFVSHAHGDHFDPEIFSWRTRVKNITYIFGWNARLGERCVDLPAPRASTDLDGLQIRTINEEHDDVPEVAYLVKVDGLAIYHAGDYIGPLDDFQSDMGYFLKEAGQIDIAFISQFKQAGSLKPRFVFPMHAWNREYMHGAFARQAAESKLPSRVLCPENKGDRWLLPLSAER